MLENKQIGEVVYVGTEKFVKVSKNYWKSEKTELFEHSLEEKVRESKGRDEKFVDNSNKRAEKNDKSVNFNRFNAKENVNAPSKEEKNRK